MGRIIQYHEIARNASQARFPNLWQGLKYAGDSSLGIQGSKLFDLSCHNNTQSFLGSGISWTPGKNGMAVNIPTTGYLQNSNVSGFGTEGTFLFWGKINASQNYTTIFSAKAGISTAVIFYSYVSGKTWISYYNTAGTNTIFLNTQTSPAAGEYVNYAFTWSALAGRLYQNGVLVDEDTDITGTLRTISNLYLGSDRAIANRGLYGDMEMCCCYNRSLTSAEIQLLYRTNGNALLQRRPGAMFKAPAAGGVVPTPYYDIFLKGVA